MRYKLLLILILCCTQVELFGQGDDPNIAPLQQQNIDTDEKLRSKLGVKFNLGGHTFRGSAFEKEKGMFGFGAGMFNIIDLTKNKRLKLQWELNLTFKGSKFSAPTDTSTVYFSKIALSYGELPVYFSYQLNKSKTPTHLLIGGQFGYLWKSSITQGLGQYGDILHNNLPFKKFDVNLCGGLRSDLGSGISLQFVVKYGLTNIYTDKFDPAVNHAYQNVAPTFKNGNHDVRNLSFELSFNFGI